MANWGIESTAPEIEKIKSEMSDYLHGLNSCAEIDYSIYSQLFDFSLPLIQKAYELGKKESTYESPELRELSLEERNSYNAGLAKLFKKTGRKFQ